MKHLDEGTIHAWLDGALTAPDARDCEEHVARCETCRAAVAEARGLVAGASRILSALDDVPAGVVPAGTARPKPRRNWTRTLSWAMAAAVVLAVGIRVGTRTQGSAPAVAPAPTPIAQAPSASPAAPPGAERKVAATNAPPAEPLKASDSVVAPAAKAARATVEPNMESREVMRGVAGGVAVPTAAGAANAVGRVRDAAVMGLAAAAPAPDTAAGRLMPLCYTNGVEHLMLDTAAVGSDMPGWRVLRDDGRVAGRWRTSAGDSITLIVTQPMQRMLVGVVRAGGLDLREMGSAAGVWMGRTACEPARR